MGFFNQVLNKFLGTKSDRDLKEVQSRVDAIKQKFSELQHISNDELRNITYDLRAQIRELIRPNEEQINTIRASIESTDITEREDLYNAIEKIEKEIDELVAQKLNEILPTAFAVMKETARRFTENKEVAVTANDFDKYLASRHKHIEIVGDQAIYQHSWIAGGNEITWDMVHYDVQLIGGIVLHEGKIAEMATGEGKTLVATLPVFLNALPGRGVHLVTVNDYLAKRDAEWMGPLYEFHGLVVDCIDKHQPSSTDRKKAYLADITFGTNNEFGFDYLRDNMAVRPQDLVQRRHNYSIVDEVDSVLIDDARTPLIISGQVAHKRGDESQFDELKPKVLKLMQFQQKLVTQALAESKQLATAGDEEKAGFLLLRAHKGLPKSKALIKFLSEEGMKSLLLKTESFYMQDKSRNMHKVTDDLYFVIDEKNNSIELTEKGIDLISTDVEDASFFILPDIGSEIAEMERSGLTDKEKRDKKTILMGDYAVKSERVHTMNQLLKAYSLFEKDIEYVVIDNKVKIVDEQTGRIMEGRRYSDGLHQAIEAKESVKVEASTQTMATITLQNYFRMYKKLAGMTGTAETEAGELWDIYKLDVVVIPTNRPIVRKDREDLVYKTKREKYSAVLDEIVQLHEAGRPVLVGTTSVEISELLSRMLKMAKIPHNVLNAKLHQREADIVAEAGKSSAVTIATNMAGRGTDIKLSKEVKRAGGLAIVGTERHESRRVDRQLRGRSGRQGDPGSSQFFVSLEDDLMRLFGSDRISRYMDRLGIKEGEVIQHSMITKSIERAQKKVEENNFGIRKRLLEYDDVMNNQREVIYAKRRHALHGEKIDVDILNMLNDVSLTSVQAYHGDSNYDGFILELMRKFSLDFELSKDDFKKMDEDEIAGKLYDALFDTYKRRVELISQQAYPVIKQVYEHQSHIYENIVVPITDGHREYQIVTNLKRAAETQGAELVRSYEKMTILATIDDSWKEHLREMDDLKQSVQNASYEQKDPLLIYKFESFNLFQTMLDKINKTVVGILLKGHIPIQDPSEIKKADEPQRQDMSRYQTSRTDVGSQNPQNPQQQQQRVQPVRVEKKVGRNDPCPCGSGKKYKNCHGTGDTAAV
ncbi:MAG: preprotein translocase subunit SecA [Bacteroidales bacterium]|nr:preprotein translocase subunit SecA [Bacteroidales bacterium]